jgi:hypothetical protein
MAKRDEQHSTGTGRVMPCLLNPIYHEVPLALPVKQGPKRFHLRCECGFRAYLPPDWTADMGLSIQQARAQGLLVLSTLVRRKM